MPYPGEIIEERYQMMPFSFLRCHQSYVVNIAKIKKITYKALELYDGRLVPVSRTYYKKAKQEILDYYEGVVL